MTTSREHTGERGDVVVRTGQSPELDRCYRRMGDAERSLVYFRLCLGLSDIFPVARDRRPKGHRTEGRCWINLKGGNRGMCPGGPMALRRYGELGGRACDDDSDRPCASIGGGGVAAGTAAASACWLTTSRATDHRNAA